MRSSSEKRGALILSELSSYVIRSKAAGSPNWAGTAFLIVAAAVTLACIDLTGLKPAQNLINDQPAYYSVLQYSCLARVQAPLPIAKTVTDTLEQVDLRIP